MALNKHIFLSIKVSITAYLFFFLFLQSFGQNHFDEKELKTYRLILNLQLERADSLLAVRTPTNRYLKTFSYSLKLFFTEDPKLYENYESIIDESLSTFDNLSDSEPYKYFYLAELNLWSALIDIKFGNELSALWNFKSAYKAISKGKELHPGFLPYKKISGLINVVVGSVPEKYSWILGILGMEGSVSTGLNELRELSSSNNHFKDQASVILALINTYVSGNAQSGLNKIDQRLIDHSYLYRFVYGSILMKNSQSSEVIKLYSMDNEWALPMVNYQLGEAYLQKGDYNMAEMKLLAFTESFLGKNLIKDAYYKLFLAAWLNDDDPKAEIYHKKANNYGQKITEADKHADKMINQEVYPNKGIMKIRLLTDGGFYQQASALVEQYDSNEFQGLKNKTEYIYRKARLKHKMSQTTAAIKLYKQVIENSGDNNWYFAPNSCLQLAELYEESDRELAHFYFKKTLSYKGHEYKNSLDTKAKRGLNRLSQ